VRVCVCVTRQQRSRRIY